MLPLSPSFSLRPLLRCPTLVLLLSSPSITYDLRNHASIYCLATVHKYRLGDGKTALLLAQQLQTNLIRNKHQYARQITVTCAAQHILQLALFVCCLTYCSRLPLWLFGQAHLISGRKSILPPGGDIEISLSRQEVAAYVADLIETERGQKRENMATRHLYNVFVACGSVITNDTV